MRHRGRVIAVAIALGVVATTVALWGSGSVRFVPQPSGSSPTVPIGGHSYAYENESLFGQNNGWLNYSFHGAVFRFHLWCAIDADTGYVCGQVLQSNGVQYPFNFSDGLPSSNPAWQTTVSPDLESAVQYLQGGQARLLIEA